MRENKILWIFGAWLVLTLIVVGWVNLTQAGYRSVQTGQTVWLQAPISDSSNEYITTTGVLNGAHGRVIGLNAAGDGPAQYLAPTTLQQGQEIYLRGFVWTAPNTAGLYYVVYSATVENLNRVGQDKIYVEASTGVRVAEMANTVLLNIANTTENMVYANRADYKATSVNTAVRVSNIDDKTGYALTNLQHTLIANTTERAVYANRNDYKATSVNTAVRVSNIDDKTGYALTNSQHTLIANTTERAVYANRSDYKATSINTVASVTGNVTVGTNNDKTGYVLANTTITAIANTTRTGITADHGSGNYTGAGADSILIYQSQYSGIAKQDSVNTGLTILRWIQKYLF